MFDWFEPRCPLATAEKLWTESHMRWLAGKLGFDRLVSSEVILPEDRFFPESYSRDPDGARTIFNRVCGYMKLDPDRYDLHIMPDESIRGAAGLYHQSERPEILLAHSQLADPERLVATIAHELAHDILLGGGLITREEDDHEPITDLVPVFLGLGLFLANATVRDRNFSNGNWHYFQIHRQGYLSSRILGYALALYAYARREARPAWVQHLRPDAAEPLKAGLRYLLKTGDTLFHPDTAHQPDAPPTEAEVMKRLATGSPTVRMRALRDLARLDPPPLAAVGAVVRCLGDRDDDVRIEAARALPIFGEAARESVPELLRCLRSRSDALRAEAAAALPAVGAPAAQVVIELTALLGDSPPAVGNAAAAGLRRFASAATRAVPALIEAIRIRETSCESYEALVDALIAIEPRPERLENLLEPIDPEIRRRIQRSLRAARFRSRISGDRSSKAGRQEE
jgi:hypothetical protein